MERSDLIAVYWQFLRRLKGSVMSLDARNRKITMGVMPSFTLACVPDQPQGNQNG